MNKMKNNKPWSLNHTTIPKAWRQSKISAGLIYWVKVIQLLVIVIDSWIGGIFSGRVARFWYGSFPVNSLYNFIFAP